MKKTVLAAATGALLLTGLAACRGGSGSATPAPGSGSGSLNPSAPSSITTTDQAAQVAVAVSAGLTNVGGGTAGTPPATAKSGFGKSSASMAGVRAKMAESCPNGGTRESIPDTSTTFTGDSTAVYVNCKQTSTGEGVTSTVLIDGKLGIKCTDSAQTANTCNADNLKFADGLNGGKDFILSQTYMSSNVNEDDTFAVRGDIAQNNTSSTTVNSTFNAALRFSDNIRKRDYAILFDNLKTVYTRTQTGATATINGGFGSASNTSQCSVGKVTIATATNMPLIYNNNNNIVSGRVTVTDSTGKGTTLQYNSDSSVTVTLPNGTTKTYTPNDLDKFCN